MAGSRLYEQKDVDEVKTDRKAVKQCLSIKSRIMYQFLRVSMRACWGRSWRSRPTSLTTMVKKSAVATISWPSRSLTMTRSVAGGYMQMSRISLGHAPKLASDLSPGALRTSIVFVVFVVPPYTESGGVWGRQRGGRGRRRCQ